MADKKWESYEEVASYLLNSFAEHFGLGKVEGKQVVPGESGTDWTIDAKGYSENGEAFVIIECKRKTSRKVNQETMGGLGYRIRDTGAAGGIFVTPLGYQVGAEKVAKHTRIEMVRLNKDCTTSDFILQFLNTIAIGIPGTDFSCFGTQSILSK